MMLTNDFTKCIILQNHWVPGFNYEFAFFLHTKRNKEKIR